MHEPDELLEIEVRGELLWDPNVDDRRIVVKAKNGRVTLSGWAPTDEQEAIAVGDTWAMSGVREVENQLLVGVAGEPRADAELAEACRRALRAERPVPEGAVKVRVAHGRATLSGQVRRLHQRVVAERAVHKVAGIIGVNSNIAITDDPVPSDVRRRAHKALRRQGLLDGLPITVTNEGHTVFLDGCVGSSRARRVAERAASAAPGVSEVVDRLSVTGDE